jgi:hypothetical protein
MDRPISKLAIVILANGSMRCGDGSASHGAVEDYRIVLLMLYIDQLGLKALFFPNLNRHLMVVMKLIENTL